MGGGWISIVLWILTHAPELVSLVRQLLAIIHTLPKAEQDQAKADLGDAIKDKDKGRLRTILEDRCKRNGGGLFCPAEIKRD